MLEIGLFPLGIVLLPTERIPLHVFEERYKELIGECLTQDLEFGLVYADDDGIRDIGTRARVAQVLARFEDGRMNILVEGRSRFRLVELTGGRAFSTGLVSAFEDRGDSPDPNDVTSALQLFRRLRELTGSEVEVPAASDEQLSFLLAGRVELDPDDKLLLLADDSERARLDRVRALLEDAVATAQRVRKAADRAATNGRVDLG